MRRILRERRSRCARETHQAPGETNKDATLLAVTIQQQSYNLGSLRVYCSARVRYAAGIAPTMSIPEAETTGDCTCSVNVRLYSAINDKIEVILSRKSMPVWYRNVQQMLLVLS